MAVNIEKSLICVQPKRFEMTNERFIVIKAEWERRGKIFLGAGEVLSLFRKPKNQLKK